MNKLYIQLSVRIIINILTVIINHNSKLCAGYKQRIVYEDVTLTDNPSKWWCLLKFIVHIT